MDIPTAAACLDLLRDLGSPGQLLRHVGLVSRAAAALAGLCRADVGYCVAGGLLHDAGKAPGAVRAAARLGGDPAALARLDHGRLGAMVLRGAGDGFGAVSSAVERHVIGSVLTGPEPSTPEDQVVFLADKMVGMSWMGFRERTADIVRRYGHEYDVSAALPGTELVFWALASRACLGRGDLESLVRASVMEDP